jgi:hypothetical protein
MQRPQAELFADNPTEQSKQHRGDQEKTPQALPRCALSGLLPGIEQIVLIPGPFA